MSARMVAGLLERAALGGNATSADFNDAIRVRGNEGIACEIRALQGEVLARSSASPASAFTDVAEGLSTQQVQGSPWRVYVLRSGGYQITTAPSPGPCWKRPCATSWTMPGATRLNRRRLPFIYSLMQLRAVRLDRGRPGARLAYEMAVVATASAVVRADDSFGAQADAVADAPLHAAVPEAPLPQGVAVPHPAAVDALPTTAAQRRPGTLPAAEMDSKILKAAIMNGALELLPEKLSTLAIIPLQMRLVYQVGQSYGYELHRGHSKDLLAALGVGLTSQYLEEAGRKLLSGLLGKAGKGLFGGLGRQAVSSGMSFASTYALGHVANQYYAGGRTLSTDMLKDAYQHVMQDGRELQARYLPQMQKTARGLNTAKILAMVRGG